MDDNFSSRVKDVITYSKEEALRLGDEFIGTEHLILGLTDVGTTFQIYKNVNTEIYNNSLKVYNKEIKNIIDILYNKYGLHHNDLHSKNICIDNNNKIRLIDFDGCCSEHKQKTKYLKLH